MQTSITVVNLIPLHCQPVLCTTLNPESLDLRGHLQHLRNISLMPFHIRSHKMRKPALSSQIPLGLSVCWTLSLKSDFHVQRAKLLDVFRLANDVLPDVNAWPQTTSCPMCRYIFGKYLLCGCDHYKLFIYFAKSTISVWWVSSLYHTSLYNLTIYHSSGASFMNYDLLSLICNFKSADIRVWWVSSLYDTSLYNLTIYLSSCTSFIIYNL